MSKWQPIETAPKDGTPVDLWLVGPAEEVSFYCSVSYRSGDGERMGRATCIRWKHKPPNEPAWYPIGGLGYPIPCDVRIEAWMPLPGPPAS